MSIPLSEAELLSHAMLLSRGDVRLLRNNVGEAWLGPWKKLADGSVLITKPRRVRYGVGNPGGGDLIGWKRVTITPDMVGQRIAQFVSIELKGPNGTEHPEQLQWAAAVESMGGISGFAYSEADIKRILGE